MLRIVVDVDCLGDSVVEVLALPEQLYVIAHHYGGAYRLASDIASGKILFDQVHRIVLVVLVGESDDSQSAFPSRLFFNSLLLRFQNCQ